MNLSHARLLTSVGLAALVSLGYAASARAQAVAPSLGTAGSYTVLGTNGIPTSGTVTCTTSTIVGYVGSTGDTITNTGPCTITEDIDAPVFPGLSMTSTTPTTRSWPSTRCATGSCRS